MTARQAAVAGPRTPVGRRMPRPTSAHFVPMTRTRDLRRTIEGRMGMDLAAELGAPGVIRRRRPDAAHRAPGVAGLDGPELGFEIFTDGCSSCSRSVLLPRRGPGPGPTRLRGAPRDRADGRVHPLPSTTRLRAGCLAATWSAPLAAPRSHRKRQFTRGQPAGSRERGGLTRCARVNPGPGAPSACQRIVNDNERRA